MKITKVEIKTASLEDLDKTIDDIVENLGYYELNHPGVSMLIEKHVDTNKAVVKICHLEENCN